MKNKDQPSPSDDSSRLDALLSDFLSKDIVAPEETQPSYATSAPLGDLFPDMGEVNEPSSPSVPTQTHMASQQVVSVNRTEIWEATSRSLGDSESASKDLRALPADQLERNVNALLADSAARGKKLLFFSMAVVLSLVAGLLIWHSRKIEAPLSEEPTVILSQNETDAPLTRAPLTATNAPDSSSGAPAEEHAANASNSNHDRPPAIAVLVPDSSQGSNTSSAGNAVSQSAATHAARLQRAPAPSLDHSNLTLGAIQGMPFLQPAPPSVPLPLPPGPPASALRNVAPDSTWTAAATPAVPLTKVQPIYPEFARKMNLAGTVRVAIVVDAAGKVISAKAVDGPSLLRGSAELAVKQWRFTPSTMNGKPVRGSGTVSVVFNLDRR